MVMAIERVDKIKTRCRAVNIEVREESVKRFMGREEAILLLRG